MVTRSMSKLAAAAGGLALSALAGAGIASADGLSEQAINTTCNYDQVSRGAAGAKPRASRTNLDSHPDAQQFLQDYLASGPSARRAKAQNAQAQDPGTGARMYHAGDQPGRSYLQQLLTLRDDGVNLRVHPVICV